MSYLLLGDCFVLDCIEKANVFLRSYDSFFVLVIGILSFLDVRAFDGSDDLIFEKFLLIKVAQCDNFFLFLLVFVLVLQIHRLDLTLLVWNLLMVVGFGFVFLFVDNH
jgi:hypothetical protein